MNKSFPNLLDTYSKYGKMLQGVLDPNFVSPLVKKNMYSSFSLFCIINSSSSSGRTRNFMASNHRIYNYLRHLESMKILPSGAVLIPFEFWMLSLLVILSIMKRTISFWLRIRPPKQLLSPPEQYFQIFYTQICAIIFLACVLSGFLWILLQWLVIIYLKDSCYCHQ